jgi:hypothetical protein
VIQLLSVAGVAHSLVTLNWTVLQGTGRMKVAFRLGLMVSVLTVASFAVGVRWGAVGVAAAYASIKLPVVLIDTYVTTRAVRFNFREALLAGGSILPHALLAAGGAWAVRIALADAGAPHVVRLLAVVTTACLLYMALLVVSAPGYVDDARNVLGQRLPFLAQPLPAPIERHLASSKTPRPARRSGWHSYRPTVLQEQLFVAALGDPDSAAEAWKGLPATFKVDDLEPGSFELIPLVYRNLAAVLPDDPELPRLKGIYRRSWVKNNLLLGRMGTIAKALRSAGIPALFLEGPTHATRFYGDLALRPTSSLHVLVPASNAAEASSMLERRGWAPRPGSGAYPGWRLLFDPGGNICVLRSSLAFDYVGRSDEPAEESLWRAAESYPVGDIEALVLTPTDAFLAAFVAGARYGPLPPTQWLTDAVMILRTAEVDWDRILDLAVTHRQHLRLESALVCLLDLPVEVPDRVGAAYAWLAGPQPTRRERLAFALSSGRLARRGGLSHAVGELVAATAGESLARTALRIPGHLSNRWGVEHTWQLPLAAGRRIVHAARRA